MYFAKSLFSVETHCMEQFLSLIQQEMELFEQRLDRALQSDVKLVHQVARYMSTVKGKRLRPALALMGAKAVGSWDDRIIDAAVVVEMIHSATMIHDDVVDSAATRRGKAYFEYFGDVAGDRDKGYYSYDLGDWHIIALNTNCGKIGGCGPGSRVHE